MSDGEAPISVDTAVRVYPGTDAETHGVIVEDFGDIAGEGVVVAGERIAAPARRWAVRLDTGDLVFVDSHELAAG
ncbi:MAG: hypothetical protein JWR32_782 [Mycobacterium sp.]|jgi:hypothetical protein|nr:hypothetical protein [Mycobacterium sp.]